MNFPQGQAIQCLMNTKLSFSEIKCLQKQSLHLHPTPLQQRDSTSYIDTFCKIKPSPSCFVRNVFYNELNDTVGIKLQNRIQIYNFFKLFDEKNNDNVATQIAAGMMVEVENGKDVLFMAFGGKFAGKSYSVIGTKRSPGVLRQFLRMTKTNTLMHGIEIIDNSPVVLGNHRQSLMFQKNPYKIQYLIPVFSDSVNQIIDNLFIGKEFPSLPLSHFVFKIYFKKQTITIVDICSVSYDKEIKDAFPMFLEQKMIAKSFSETITQNPKSYLVRLVHNEVKQNTKIMVLFNINPIETKKEQSLMMLKLARELRMLKPGKNYFRISCAEESCKSGMCLQETASKRSRSTPSKKRLRRNQQLENLGVHKTIQFKFEKERCLNHDLMPQLVEQYELYGKQQQQSQKLTQQFISKLSHYIEDFDNKFLTEQKKQCLRSHVFNDLMDIYKENYQFQLQTQNMQQEIQVLMDVYQITNDLEQQKSILNSKIKSLQIQFEEQKILTGKREEQMKIEKKEVQIQTIEIVNEIIQERRQQPQSSIKKKKKKHTKKVAILKPEDFDMKVKQYENTYNPIKYDMRMNEIEEEIKKEQQIQERNKPKIDNYAEIDDQSLINHQTKISKNPTHKFKKFRNNIRSKPIQQLQSSSKESQPQQDSQQVPQKEGPQNNIIFDNFTFSKHPQIFSDSSDDSRKSNNNLSFNTKQINYDRKKNNSSERLFVARSSPKDNKSKPFKKKKPTKRVKSKETPYK